MPRKPRIEFAGAIYHVMSRGNRQEPIYRDDRDCEMFLDTLDEACSRTGWCIHAFVLMGNHYHLLLETPEPNLVAGMKWLQGTYTQRFNARHKLWGHLLQGRYKALMVDGGDGYFSTVGNYIHLNPARAGMVDPSSGRLADFRWSSFPLYLQPGKRPAWLGVERLFGALGLEDSTKGRRLYREFMAKRVVEIAHSDNPAEADKAWAKIRRGWCFGDDAFRKEMLDRIEKLGGKRESFSGAPIRLHDEWEAESMLQKGLKLLKLEEANLLQLPKGADEKALLSWLIRRNSVVTNTWIAERLHMGRPDCLSRYPNRIEHSTDPNIVKLKKKLSQITRLRD